jgi:hypothetical protein
MVESYTITDMAHGTPLGLADNDERYGAEGAFLIEAGISSSYHIASFFGLTGRISQPRAAETVAGKAARPAPQPSTPRTPEVAAALRPIATLHRPADPPPQPRRRAIDVSAVITRALTAAGLMK